jgi:hypothetical protein
MTQSTDRADAASKHCRATCPAARAPQMAVPADGKITVSPGTRANSCSRTRPLRPVPPQNNTEISPLFKCDSATRAFLKDGKITVIFSG